MGMLQTYEEDGRDMRGPEAMGTIGSCVGLGSMGTDGLRYADGAQGCKQLAA